MANVNAPNGFTPVRHATGGEIRAAGGYRIENAKAINLGTGDIVVNTGTGNELGAAVNGVSGAAAVGVFAGCKYQDAKGNIVYSPNWVSGTVTKGSAGAEAFVYDDPQIVFEVQASAGFAAANPGQFAGIVATAPDAATGRSKQALDSADISGTLDNLKILGLAPRAGNEYGNYARVEVLLAFHARNSGSYLPE